MRNHTTPGCETSFELGGARDSSMIDNVARVCTNLVPIAKSVDVYYTLQFRRRE